MIDEWGSFAGIAVGTAVASRPPHRSVREGTEKGGTEKGTSDFGRFWCHQQSGVESSDISPERRHFRAGHFRATH